MKKITSNRRAGFTLVEIMIVVAIIGLLAAMVIPNLMGARTKSQTTACINNLRIIDGAKQQWGMEAKKFSTDTPTEDELKPFLGNKGAAGDFPACPASGSYIINNLSVTPACSAYNDTNHPAKM